MYFHHPWFLAALPLALAPAVFHLLSLRRTVAVRFAWTHLVHRALRQSSVRRKIVDIAVLALRCLLIAVCLLFFARPVGHVDPTARTRVRLTIALDTSLSMRTRLTEGEAFRRCIDRADQLLRLLEPTGAPVDVVSFDTAVRQVTPGMVVAGTARTAIAGVSPGWLGTDLGALLRWWTARAAQRDREFGAPLHHKLLVLTDRAAHGVRDVPVASTHTAAHRMDVLFWSPALPRDNGRIRDVTYEDADEGVVAVRCMVAGVAAGSQAILLVDGRGVDALTVDGVREWQTFSWNPQSRRDDALLEIKIPDDALPEDNVFRCVYRGRSRRRLRCRVEEPFDVRGVASMRFYLERLEGAGWEVVWATSAKETRPWTLELWAGQRTLPTDVTAGEPLLVFPAPDADAVSYDRFAEGVEFIELREFVDQPVHLVNGQDEDFNRFCAQYDLRNIAIRRAWRMTITRTASGWRPVLYFNDGTPAIVVRGSVWLSAFPLDPASSNVMLKPFFIGLLGYVAGRGTHPPVLERFATAGVPLAISGCREITVHPAGTPVTETEASFDAASVLFRTPGWYRAVCDAGALSIGVNPDPREGDLSAATPEQLRRALRGAGIGGAPATIEMFREGDVSEAAAWCQGREYSDFLTVGIVLLFIAETVLSRLGKRLV